MVNALKMETLEINLSLKLNSNKSSVPLFYVIFKSEDVL